MYHGKSREHFPSERKVHTLRFWDKGEHDAFKDLTEAKCTEVQVTSRTQTTKKNRLYK